jgi:hypothetical protein
VGEDTVADINSVVSSVEICQVGIEQVHRCIEVDRFVGCFGREHSARWAFESVCR